MSYQDFVKKKRAEKVSKLKNIVNDKMGQWLNWDLYDGIKFTCSLKCSNGHYFTLGSRGLEKGYWCSYCKGNAHLGETMARVALEIILGFPLKKTRRIADLNRIHGYNLEIDGFNENEKIGFEYQGVQHYKFIPFIHKTEETFLKQQIRDSIKKQFFINKNWTLIEVKYFSNFNFENVIITIKEILIEKNIKTNELTFEEIKEKFITQMNTLFSTRSNNKKLKIDRVKPKKTIQKNRSFWSLDLAIETLSKYKDTTKLYAEQKSLINWLRQNDLYMELTKGIIRKGRFGKRDNTKITKSTALNLSSQYKTRIEFRRNYPRAYKFILKNGLKQEAFSHMGEPTRFKNPKKYSDEYLILAAKKYKSISDLRKNENNIRAIIMRRCLQEKAFSHMIKKK